MSTSYATTHRASWPTIPRALGVLILLCLLGLTISIAVFLQLDADSAASILDRFN
jgi:hypothetical protein